MKVFISWSGERSKIVAFKLRHWLPRVIQSIEPWMSDTDIPAGAQWHSALSQQLDSTFIEIICLTKDNYNNPFILFEAGAISKTFDKEPLVCPYLIDHTLEEFQSLPAPLIQFQAKTADEKGTRELIHALNKSLDKNSLKSDLLDDTYEHWWPDLQSTLNALRPPDIPSPNPQLKSISSFKSKFNKEYEITVLALNQKGRENRKKKLKLTWETFGYGIEHLADSLKEAPHRIHPNIIFGINPAGIMVAAYLSYFYGAHLGIIRTTLDKNEFRTIEQFDFPNTKDADTSIEDPNLINPRCVAVVDSEIKSGQSGKCIIDKLENRYKNARIIYIVLGGVIKPEDFKKDHLNIEDFGWDVPLKYKPDFLAFYIDPPGFEPPGGIN